MLPFTRSIMGCAESGPWNVYFYSVSGGGNPGPVILVGAQNIGRDLGAPCRKWGCSKHIFALYVWHVLLGWIWCETGFFFAMCKNAQNCGENVFFLHCRCQICNMKAKIGVSEKKAKIYFWGRTHHHLCVFWCRASFWQKTVFPKSTKFRWNHWKRSAKLARPQNAILAPEGPKWAILVRVTKRSRYICRCISGACRYIFKKTRTIVWYFLLFPFLTTSHFLSF